jgi:asparagine synthase (glutamine-hydrolysing)
VLQIEAAGCALAARESTGSQVTPRHKLRRHPSRLLFEENGRKGRSHAKKRKMCGIVGFVDRKVSTPQFDLHTTVRRMADCVRYRGPDSEGYWENASAGVALGHRRLAIIDLSPAGEQPMHSRSGRFVIVFNGEIYNFPEIRQELLRSDTNLQFRGHSDTEVMLASFEFWGVQEAVKRLNGMFAFALWDRDSRRLYLGRDRMGEKPVYYSTQGSTFLFASELKALRAHPAFAAGVSRAAVREYLRLSHVPAPLSIYEGVYKLPPGCLLTLEPDKEPRVSSYWNFDEAVQRGLANPFRGSDADAVEGLDHLLRDAVRMRMLADVPLGVFLSGGIDSSTITALMQAQSVDPVRSFSIGFREAAFDESADARAVANHLGTRHTELVATPAEAREVIPLLPEMYDEPFGDSSQIPTHLVARMTHNHVTVALSGDGGDEIFGGYNRHVWVAEIWNRMGGLPRSARRALARGLSFFAPQTWDQVLSLHGSIRSLSRSPGEKIHKIAAILGSTGPDTMYSRLISHCNDSAKVVVGSPRETTSRDRPGWLDSLSIAEQIMYLDAASYLPDDIFTKVDRATMAVSLEARAPFVDHKVVEFAWTLPLAMKVREKQGKWILRQVLKKYVPASMFERPKTGFAIPLSDWLRGPLRGWSEDLLNEDRLRREGYLDPRLVRSRWERVLKGEGNWQFHIWDILMFEAWLEVNSRPEPAVVNLIQPQATV